MMRKENEGGGRKEAGLCEAGKSALGKHEVPSRAQASPFYTQSCHTESKT